MYEYDEPMSPCSPLPVFQEINSFEDQLAADAEYYAHASLVSGGKLLPPWVRRESSFTKPVFMPSVRMEQEADHIRFRLDPWKETQVSDEPQRPVPTPRPRPVPAPRQRPVPTPRPVSEEPQRPVPVPRPRPVPVPRPRPVPVPRPRPVSKEPEVPDESFPSLAASVKVSDRMVRDKKEAAEREKLAIKEAAGKAIRAYQRRVWDKGVGWADKPIPRFSSIANGTCMGICNGTKCPVILSKDSVEKSHRVCRRCHRNGNPIRCWRCPLPVNRDEKGRFQAECNACYSARKEFQLCFGKKGSR